MNLKLLFLCFLSVILLNCKEEKKPERKQPKLEIFLTNFLKENPNWNQNDIVNEQVNKKFEEEIEIQIKNGILNDFPLELGEINEYSDGKYAAVFSSHYIKSDAIDYQNILYNTNFDVIGLIPKDKISILQKDKTYTIKGTFKKFLTGDFRDYINGMVYTPSVEISKDMSNTDVSIGIILMEISEIKEVPKL